MKLFYCCLFGFILSQSIVAQKFTYPTIATSVKDFKTVSPEKWEILDTVFGDLNKDSRLDMVLVLQHKTLVNVYKSIETYTETVNTKPRLLAIYFKDSVTDSYRLIEQSNSFIMNDDDTVMLDPFQSVSIIKGSLHLNFQISFSKYSPNVVNVKYRFRFESNEFQLIGAEKFSFNRATHDFENFSFNFITKKWNSLKGNDITKIQSEKVWFPIEIDKPKTFKTFTKPFTLQIAKSIFI